MNKERYNFKYRNSNPYPTIDKYNEIIERFKNGPRKENYQNIRGIPKEYILNNVEPKYELVFIGDISYTANKILKFDDIFSNFVKDSNFLIANLEGCLKCAISNNLRKNRIGDVAIDIEIFDAIRDFFPLEKIFLSVANNHIGDYDLNTFMKTKEYLEKMDFNIFGYIDKPFADLNEDIRIIGGSMWSNRPCAFITNIYDSEKNIKKKSFNILYPHWGYELCEYPSTELVQLGKQLLIKFDAIIGLHAHTPQPITIENNKLLAYCIGNMTCNHKKLFQHMHCNKGIVIKINIGENLWKSFNWTN